MKKVLIVVLLSMFSAIIINQFQEVEASTLPFEVTFNSPRFTYLYDSVDEINNFSVDFTETRDYYDDKEMNYNIFMEQIDINGNFVKRLEYNNISLIPDDNYAVYTTVIDITILTLTVPTEYDLHSFIAGEVISVDNAFFESGVVMASHDYHYEADSGIVHILPNNTFLNEVVSIQVTFFQGTNYIYEYEYDWTNLLWSLDDIVYYRLKYNDFIITSGAILKETPPDPIYNATTLESVEVGDFFFEGDTPDFADQTGFTYSKLEDDYLIIFYELKTGVIYGDLGTDFNFVFTDISNNTLEYTFTVSDLIYYQNMTYDIAYDIPESLREGFIVLGINGETNFIKTDLPLLNDKLLYNDFDVGSYILSFYDYDASTLRDISSVVINIIDEGEPFEIDMIYENVIIGGNQVIQFIKNDLTINDNYTTTEAYDPSINFDYTDYVNNVNTTYGITYQTIDELLTINPYWTLEPVNLPYSLDSSDYAITVTTSYNTVETLTTEGRINNLITNSSFNSDLGRLFLTLLIFLIVNVLISLNRFTRSSISYVIVNISLIFLFTYLDFIALWFSLGIGVLLALMMLLIFNRTEVSRE